MALEKGYIQVYTGNGKGKTTAALGVALRCLCAGNKVFFGQFMKGMVYSEQEAMNKFPGLTMELFGNDCFVGKFPAPEDYVSAKQGLERMKEAMVSGEYDMMVFDELNTALFFHLVELEDVMAVLDLKPERTEVILTGRYAPQELQDRADLVSEMQEVKHYYKAGVEARTGIER